MYQGLAVHPVKRKLGFKAMKIKKAIVTVLVDTLAMQSLGGAQTYKPST